MDGLAGKDLVAGFGTEWQGSLGRARLGCSGRLGRGMAVRVGRGLMGPAVVG